MGFNNSASTTTLQVHLTEYGRRLLFQGSLGDTIKTFTLGDSDRDYRNNEELGNGFVPDVTGDYEGVSSLNSGFTIKHKLCYTGKQGNIKNYRQVEKAIKKNKYVFNFAGVSDIDEANQFPLKTINYNIIGTVNILEAIKKKIC